MAYNLHRSGATAKAQLDSAHVHANLPILNNITLNVATSKTKDYDDAFVEGTFNWLVLPLTENVALMTVWGSFKVKQLATGYVNVVTAAEEPLFERFVGSAEKLALKVSEDDGSLSIGIYSLDNTGLNVNVETDTGALDKVVNFSEALILCDGVIAG